MHHPLPWPPSLWHQTCDVEDSLNRAPLDGGDVDVVIVGGGFGGLWTARELVTRRPHTAVVVLEANRCGWGASGRNGGWCSALFPVPEAQLAARHGAEAAAAQMAAMRDAVDEVGRAAAAEGIDCHYAKGGTLTLATSPAHVDRVRAAAGEHEVWLDASAARERVGAAELWGATHTPHCAALHPARLATGLADAVERRGVRIAEGTTVAAIEPGRVHLASGGTVRAPVVLRCTEGYTASLAGERRTLLPVYSLMIATEPLDDRTWASIGLHRRETFTDGRHLLVYGQRTADGRLAFGGRGAPYHFGSRLDPRQDLEPRVFDALEATLRELFPQLGAARITHRWGGPLGVPRDWHASVGFDPATGLGWAGGYVGDGVSTTNLAGRTLADLVTGADTALVHLPWVGHRSPRWEPEPLRWLGVNAGTRLAAAADRREARTGRPDRLAARALDRLLGAH